MDYDEFTVRLLAASDTEDNDTEFLDYVPQIIDQAEQRCYRELDLLNTVVRDASAACTTGSRDFTLPQSLGRFVVTNGINIITPSGAIPSNGTRNQVIATSLNVLDALYPSNVALSATVPPTYYAPVTDQTVAFGPAPGAPFQVEVVGTIRPNPLSPSVTTTFLSLYLPDLFFAAAMVASAGYQRDFGAQSDDPKSAVSWEQIYQQALASAIGEETRRKYSSAGWTSAAPAPATTQPR